MKLSILTVTAANSPAFGTSWHRKGFDLDKGTPSHKARKLADSMQTDFDADCDPVRVYVCVDAIPIYAGGAIKAEQPVARLFGRAGGARR